MQLGSPQLLGTVSKYTKMEKPSRWKNKDVLYVEVKVNGQPSIALVDTGATHNFVRVEEEEKLGLKVKEDKRWIKTVNS